MELDEDKLPVEEDLFAFTKTPVEEHPVRIATQEISDAIASFVGYMGAALDDMTIETADFTSETNGYELTDLIDPVDFVVDPPVLQASDVELVDRSFDGVAPEFTDSIVSTPDPPDVNLSDPNISIPDAPNLEIPGFDGEAPSIDTPVLPGRPSYTLPPMPEISDIAIPDPPTYNIPDFDGEVPSFDMTPPSGDLDWAESGYDSQLKTQLDGKLASDVAADSTGLDSVYEEGIYGRARSRQEDEHARSLTEGLNFFSSRGIQLPGAALASIQTEVLARVAQVRTDLENDIDIQEAKLTDEHGRFTKESSVGWVNVLIAYHDKAKARALDAAKSAVAIMIAVYQSKVDGYKAQMSAYSAMADAYRSRIAAELGKAELYRAQIEGKKMAVTVQSSMIAAYTAQVESVFIIADIYTTEMEAARIQAEIDKIKMEAYSARVKAYRYEIEAQAAKYEIYMAQMRGEEAKVKVYAAMVKAYEARVEGYVAMARVQIARIDVMVENLKAKADKYAAQVRKFAADAKRTVGLADIRVISQAADNTNYDANQRPQLARMRARGQISISRANESAAHETANARMGAAGARMGADAAVVSQKIQAGQIRAEGRKAAANISVLSKSTNISNTEVDDQLVHRGVSQGGIDTNYGSLRIGTYHKYKR